MYAHWLSNLMVLQLDDKRIITLSYFCINNHNGH